MNKIRTIEEARKEIESLLIKTLYLKSNNSSSDYHPLRVMQALKSIMGLDVQMKVEPCLEWANNFISEYQEIEKTRMASFPKTSFDFVSIQNIYEAIKNKDEEKTLEEFEKLIIVSEGEHIMEFMLELSLQQSGRSFGLVWSAYRTMKFCGKENLLQLYQTIVNCLLLDNFENQKIEIENNFLPTKWFEQELDNSFKQFELVCHGQQIWSEKFIRRYSIKRSLTQFMSHRLDCNEIVKRSVFNNPIPTTVDKLIDTLDENKNNEIPDRIRYISENMKRKWILEFVQKKINRITPRILLALDAYRTALKWTEKKHHGQVGIMLGNQLIEEWNA